MHVTKLNVQKSANVQRNLATSTHIKTPIMSHIMTKPKEWQVRPAIVARLTDLTIPQTDCVLVRLLGCDIM